MALYFGRYLKDYPEGKFKLEAENRLSVFDTSTAAANTSANTRFLTDYFGWNGTKKVWCWGQTEYTVDGQNKRDFDSAINTQEKGMTFDFGDRIEWSGRFCIGNLQFDGVVKVRENGLVVKRGTKVIYTTFPQF